MLKIDPKVLVKASPPVELVLRRLERVELQVGKRDAWRAECPAHGDQSQSLSIGIGRDGRCLLCCAGGCSAVEIVDAIGLRLADLFMTLEERRDWERVKI